MFFRSGDSGDKENLNLEYLKMLRVREWIKFFAPIPLIGAILAPATPFVLISVGVIFFCVIAFGFVVNNYFDVEIDLRNTKKVRRGNNPLSSGRVTKRGTFALMCLLLATAITLACFLSPGISGVLFTLLSISLLTLYSVNHIRLKERFIVDILTHGLMFGLFPVLAGFTLAGGDLNLNTHILLVAALFMIIGCESLLTHQINDYEEDLGYSSTTVVKVGLKKGWFLLASVVLLSIAILELIVHYSDTGLVLHSAAVAYLVAYPFYTCRNRNELQGVINTYSVYAQ
uniref:Protoheme IX farnesyltransferase n=1 Tax=Candidatus Methanophagaceae archaeon ANME-1 ERB6 TaxID=2759912 RepID=A0A7G9Z021_9EURY|nr:protoheme IX farnesyltransferase [Methanosarcinales archaeon ANME-1 ERB6]